jgi:hypothetical protein
MDQKSLSNTAKLGLILAAAVLFLSTSVLGSEPKKTAPSPEKEKKVRITKVWAIAHDSADRRPAGANPWVAESYVPGAPASASDQTRGRYIHRWGPLTLVKDHSKRNLEIRDEDKTWGRDGFLFSSPWW